MAETDHWGKLADAQERTGLNDITEAELAKAGAVIEVITGAVFAFTASLLNKADRYWIDAAAGYMVPFIRDNPDFLTRMDASAFAQDGAQVTLKADSLVLPPMARRCLKKLSWKGTRTLLPVQLRRAVRDARYPVLPPGSGVVDYDGERWAKL